MSFSTLITLMYSSLNLPAIKLFFLIPLMCQTKLLNKIRSQNFCFVANVTRRSPLGTWRHFFISSTRIWTYLFRPDCFQFPIASLTCWLRLYLFASTHFFACLFALFFFLSLLQKVYLIIYIDICFFIAASVAHVFFFFLRWKRV